MNWLVFLFVLQLGYSPESYSYLEIPESMENKYTENIFYVQLETEIQLFDYFFIGGGIKTHIRDKKNSFYFRPEQSSYLFNAGLRYKNVEIGYQHLCIHPVVPYHYNFEPVNYFDAGYDEFYIRISNGSK